MLPPDAQLLNDADDRCCHGREALTADGRPLPPAVGDVWRMFFGQLQWLEAAGELPQPAWCWTPHGVLDAHQPERFTRVRVSTRYLEA